MRIKDLAKEFPREDISWRAQGTPYNRRGTFSAMALAYIDARDVMDRLDDVCGPENWQDEYTTTQSGLTICRIGIKIGDGWVWKSDGAGETAVEGKKGGISDALKRAAVHWGIGRYLYRLDAPWCDCEINEKNGKTYFKKWIGSPWDKVKKTTYHAAEETKEEIPEQKQLSWAQTVVQDMPKNSTPRDKAEAIATALCSQWGRMKGEKQMSNEWDRRAEIIGNLEEKHADLHEKVVDAYEMKLMEIKGNG